MKQINTSGLEIAAILVIGALLGLGLATEANLLNIIRVTVAIWAIWTAIKLVLPYFRSLTKLLHKPKHYKEDVLTVMQQLHADKDRWNQIKRF